MRRCAARFITWAPKMATIPRIKSLAMVLKRMPETVVTYKDMTFGGDMRDITVSYEKIQRELGFQTRLNPG